jgi:hypothetical protein
MNNAQSARMLRVPGNIGAESPGILVPRVSGYIKLRNLKIS